MTELGKIAQPYARALFELAQEDKDLVGWGQHLDSMAGVVVDSAVVELAKNPRIDAERFEKFVLTVMQIAILNGAGRAAPPDADFDLVNEFVARVILRVRHVKIVNLVKILVRNNRLAALPQIARLFAAHRAAAERVIEAEMTTATEMNESQRKEFTVALQVKLERKVKLHFSVDPELIGGAVVRAGDWVMDESVRGQLQKLRVAVAR